MSGPDPIGTHTPAPLATIEPLHETTALSVQDLHAEIDLEIEAGTFDRNAELGRNASNFVDHFGTAAAWDDLHRMGILLSHWPSASAQAAVAARAAGHGPTPGDEVAHRLEQFHSLAGTAAYIGSHVAGQDEATALDALDKGEGIGALFPLVAAVGSRFKDPALAESRMHQRWGARAEAERESPFAGAKPAQPWMPKGIESGNNNVGKLIDSTSVAKRPFSLTPLDLHDPQFRKQPQGRGSVLDFTAPSPTHRRAAIIHETNQDAVDGASLVHGAFIVRPFHLNDEQWARLQQLCNGDHERLGLSRWEAEIEKSLLRMPDVLMISRRDLMQRISEALENANVRGEIDSAPGPEAIARNTALLENGAAHTDPLMRPALAALLNGEAGASPVDVKVLREIYMKLTMLRRQSEQENPLVAKALGLLPDAFAASLRNLVKDKTAPASSHAFADAAARIEFGELRRDFVHRSTEELAKLLGSRVATADRALGDAVEAAFPGLPGRRAGLANYLSEKFLEGSSLARPTLTRTPSEKASRDSVGMWSINAWQTATTFLEQALATGRHGLVALSADRMAGFQQAKEAFVSMVALRSDAIPVLVDEVSRADLRRLTPWRVYDRALRLTVDTMEQSGKEGVRKAMSGVSDPYLKQLKEDVGLAIDNFNLLAWELNRSGINELDTVLQASSDRANDALSILDDEIEARHMDVQR